MNNHHLIWRGCDYQTSTERRFRGLPCLQVRLDREVHELLHRLQAPPEKPDRAVMSHFIKRHDDRECACFQGGNLA